MAKYFLGRPQYFHHYISLLLIVGAVVLVGLVGILHTSDDSSSSDEATTSLFGIGLLIISQCFAGGLMISEEKLLSGYYLDPLMVVGLEGFWGLLCYSVLLPIFQNWKCTGQLCPDGVLEDTHLAFQQMGINHRLILQSVGIIVSIACFNATGVTITKYASAAQRSTIDTSRTVLIWAIALMQHQEVFIWGEFFGFIILVGATLVYNEIVVIPCDLFSRNTRKQIKIRE